MYKDNSVKKFRLLKDDDFMAVRYQIFNRDGIDADLNIAVWDEMISLYIDGPDDLEPIRRLITTLQEFERDFLDQVAKNDKKV